MEETTKENSTKVEEMETSSGRPICSCTVQKWRYVEIVALALVMLVVWISLALPVIFFYLPVPDLESPPLPAAASGNCSGMASGCGELSSTSGNATDDAEAEDVVMVSNLTCREDFFLVRGNMSDYCAPQCPGYTQHPLPFSLLIDKLVLAASCIGVVCAVAVLVVSVFRRHHILKFPTVFVFYYSITMLVLDIVFVINFIDRESLFCKSKNLLVSLLDPTPFCIFSGALFYYSLIQITLWWFFHICCLFWIFRFPLHFRAFKKHMRYIHVILVLLALIVPIVPVVVTMSDYAVTDRNDPTAANGLGFGITNLPPILCSGLDANATFYSICFTITVFAEIGMTLLIFAFWNIRKSTKHKSKVKKGQFRVGSGERKILIVLIYYAFLNVFALMAFTLSTRNVSQYRHALKGNFLCERFGHNPAKPCDRSQVDSLKFPEINIFAYLLLVLIPCVNLIFVINYRKLKHWFCVHILRDRSHIYLRSQSSITASRVHSTTRLYSMAPSTEVRKFSLASVGRANAIDYDFKNIMGTEELPPPGEKYRQSDSNNGGLLTEGNSRQDSVTSPPTLTNGTTQLEKKHSSSLDSDAVSPHGPAGHLYTYSSEV